MYNFHDLKCKMYGVKIRKKRKLVKFVRIALENIHEVDLPNLGENILSCEVNGADKVELLVITNYVILNLFFYLVGHILDGLPSASNISGICAVMIGLSVSW